MQRALILYNPSSGKGRHRKQDIELMIRVLQDAGIETRASVTENSERAAAQAREAAASGCDAVIACGGDGTVNDVLQGLVGTQTSLGVIPLGTANALAHDLNMPRRPLKAARALLHAEPRSYPLGRISYRDKSGQPASKYFTVAVGVGADAHLFYKLDQQLKGKWGMAAYYAKATQVWFTIKMRYFEVEFRDLTDQPVPARVTEMLAVRIRNFGGVLRTFAPGAELARQDLRLVLFKTSSRLRYLQYILHAASGGARELPGIELRNAVSVTCRPAPGSGQRIYVEADGELVGTLPAELSVVPDAIRLLVPKK
jgi:YegS/Rv2252/BmrU family lipid kinase